MIDPKVQDRIASSEAVRSSLWPSRWPTIALQSCIDELEAAKPEERDQVKWALPCDECEMNTSCLNGKRKELGPLLYDREIQTSPRSSESSLFPMKMFEPMLDRSLEQVPHYVKPFSVEDRYGVCSSWDLAWSEQIGGDWIVKMTGLVDRETGKKKILDIGRWQKLSFDDQIHLIAAEHARFHDDLVVLEGDAAQVIWRQHMQRNTSVPVVSHGSGEKRDLQAGVPGLLIELETLQWVFPYKQGSRGYENMRVFLSEAEAFGWHDGKLEGVGEHDDTVMCWWHLSWGLNRLKGGQMRELYTRRESRGRQI